MSGALFALLAALLAGTGSREQLLVVAQVVREGRRGATLLAIVAATLATCGVAAALGATATGLEPRARTVLTGLCLVLAALALGWRSGRAVPDSAALPLPRTLGFAAILLVTQVNGPLPLAIAAVAARGHGMAQALAGGTLGALLALLVAWAAGEELARLPMARLRAGAAAILGIAGLIVLWPIGSGLLRG